jgi:hypothetical protein
MGKAGGTEADKSSASWKQKNGAELSAKSESGAEGESKQHAPRVTDKILLLKGKKVDPDQSPG